LVGQVENPSDHPVTSGFVCGVLFRARLEPPGTKNQDFSPRDSKGIKYSYFEDSKGFQRGVPKDSKEVF